MKDQPHLPVSTATPLRLVLPASEPAQRQLVLYNPPKKKRRTKLVPVEESSPSRKTLTRPRKPDPGAPKITRPCTECGKTFWSWKALFGHMRCHPERQWRGINPPANLRRDSGETSRGPFRGGGRVVMTAEDHEVAACLLLLANGPSRRNELDVNINGNGNGNANANVKHGFGFDEEVSPNGVGFECSSCKKVFGSHQALGGHRASHKNVKGCFAINNRGADMAEGGGGEEEREREMGNIGLGHKCGICMRIFSSGQALGGHKRCHFEKGGLNCFDLNLPAPVEDYNEFSDPFGCFSSELALDLRLGI